MTKTILVTGATGQQGGAVVRHLLRRGLTVRALTRNPSGPAAQALTARGADVVQGDLNDSESLQAPLTGVDGVFSVQDYYAPGAGYEGEIRQGRNLVEAARTAGVGHFVQSTMADAPGSEAVRHFQSKFEVEQAVRASGMGWTFIGTVWFMDNLLNKKMGGLMSFPFLAGALPKDRPFEMLAVDDVGAVVAEVFAAPEAHTGKKIDLAGDRMTVVEMKAVFRNETGRRAPGLFFPKWLGRLLSKDFAEQLVWQAETGWHFPLEEARAVWPGMRSFSAYLKEHREAFA